MYHFSLTTDLSISTSLRDKRPQALTLTRESTLVWRFVKRAEGRKWLNREVEMDVLPLYPGSLRGGCWRLGGVPGCAWTDDRGAVISDNGTYRDECGLWDDFEGSIVSVGPDEQDFGSGGASGIFDNLDELYLAMADGMKTVKLQWRTTQQSCGVLRINNIDPCIGIAEIIQAPEWCA